MSLFTATPDFDQPEGWTKFVGKYVIVQPQTRLHNVVTKYGTQEAWDCVVWEATRHESGNSFLDPTPGIRIFNAKLVSALDLAYQQNAPIAGLVYRGGRNGQATVIKNDSSPTMELLGSLWNEGNPVTARDMPLPQGATDDPF